MGQEKSKDLFEGFFKGLFDVFSSLFKPFEYIFSFETIESIMDAFLGIQGGSSSSNTPK